MVEKDKILLLIQITFVIRKISYVSDAVFSIEMEWKKVL